MSVALNTKHLSSFISEEEYAAIYPQVEAAHKQLEAKNGPGSDFLGWMYLPRDYDKEEFARIKEAAAKKIREDSDVLVVAGIGGSYLGARAVIEAVKGLYHNELEDGPEDLLLRQQHQPHLPERYHQLCARASASPSTSSPSPAPPPRPAWRSVCCASCWKRRWAWRKPTSASTPPPTVPRAP